MAFTKTIPAKPIVVKPVRFRQLDTPAHNSSWAITLCILTVDFFALSAVLASAVLCRHLLSPRYPLFSFFEMFPYIVMMLCALWIQGLYPAVLMHPAEELRRIAGAITAVFLVMACAAFLWRNGATYSRSVYLLTWAAGAPMVALARRTVRVYAKRFSWWGVPALILGSGPTAQRVARTLRDGRWGVKVAGVLSDEPLVSWPSDLAQVVGPLNLAPRLAKEGVAQYVIIAMPQKSSQEIRRVVQECCHGFQHVLFVPDMPGICSLGIAAREVGGEVGFEMPQRLFQRGPELVKRSVDFIASLTGLMVLAPLFAVIAVAVKVQSGGPAFYRQPRYGKGGKVFGALKFRTMIEGADAVLANYLAEHPEHLFEWQRDHKLRKDPRITSIGKWLRRLSLDELPQLLNVLAGQMSLVGPRPIVQAEIEKYGRRFDLYSRVRPGITGLWQVSGRNNTTYQERIELDEYYVHNWSVWFDTYLLLRTIRTVFTREGAY